MRFNYSTTILCSLIVISQFNGVCSKLKILEFHRCHREPSNERKQQSLNASTMNVGIVGAGISGLYAALLLQDLGIEYEIFEASHRTGGRIYTHYFGKQSKYEYVDLGASRFPKDPVYDRLIGKQKWSLISHLNRRLEPKRQIKLIDFIGTHENNVFYFNGISKLYAEFKKSGDFFGFGKKDGGYIDDNYAHENSNFWFRKAYDFIALQFKGNFSDGVKYWLRNDQTFRSWLTNPNNRDFAYPSDVVDWIETFIGETGALSSSLMRTYLMASISSTEGSLEIEGGYSKLIAALESVLKHRPKLNHQITGLSQKANKNIILQIQNMSQEYSHVIVTPQFSVLRDIDFNLNLNPKKRVAMRTLNYENAVKIGLLFKSRFWENSSLMNGKPILGGKTLTDLMIRQTLYPSYGINCSDCRGALIASYTGAKDAKKFIAFSESEMVQIALKDLSKIHGSIVNEQFTGEYAMMDWTKNPFTQGAYPLFDPGHYESFYPALIEPDAYGRLHFAGDTLGLYHGWSISALKSAYRAVKNILKEQGLGDKLKELKSKWGEDEEHDKILST